MRAQRAGLPPPPLSSYNPFSHHERSSQIYAAPSGIIGKIKSTFQSLKGSGSGSRSGAYEQPLGAGGRRGLDPDEAWDARVGAEADGYGAGGYYEEQELGLRPPGREGYSGGGYDGNGTTLPDYGHEDMGRGRSISREGDRYIGGGQKGLDERYDEEMGRKDDPFGDGAERSELRGVSPRPHEDKRHTKQGSGGGQHDDSPTERRSMFHEGL